MLPSFGYLDAALAQRLTAFVRRGGRLVCTAGTGIRNADNQALASTPPGPLRVLLGGTVEECGGFRRPRLELVMADGRAIPAPSGYEILAPRGAKVVARWRDLHATADGPQPHPAHGTPALTRHRVGRGAAFALGTWLTAENATPLAVMLAGKPLAQAAPSVSISRRVGGARQLWFLLNHDARPQRVTGLPAGREQLTGRDCRGEWLLPPYGVAVLRATSRPAL